MKNFFQEIMKVLALVFAMSFMTDLLAMETPDEVVAAEITDAQEAQDQTGVEEETDSDASELGDLSEEGATEGEEGDFTDVDQDDASVEIVLD